MHTFSNVNPGIESEPSLKYRFGRTGCINLRRVSSLVLGMLAAADNPTPAGRAASFISFVGTVTGKMHVEFEIICQRLRRRVLESVARERYGDEAVRIIRMLLDNGKMGGDQVKLSLGICYIGSDIHKLSHNFLDC